MLRSYILNLLISLLGIVVVGYAVYSTFEERAPIYFLGIQAVLALYLIYALSSNLLKTYREWRYQPSRLR